jgi:hypothetical protein
MPPAADAYSATPTHERGHRGVVPVAWPEPAVDCLDEGGGDQGHIAGQLAPGVQVRQQSPVLVVLRSPYPSTHISCLAIPKTARRRLLRGCGFAV